MACNAAMVQERFSDDSCSACRAPAAHSHGGSVAHRLYMETGEGDDVLRRVHTKGFALHTSGLPRSRPPTLLVGPPELPIPQLAGSLVFDAPALQQPAAGNGRSARTSSPGHCPHRSIHEPVF